MKKHQTNRTQQQHSHPPSNKIKTQYTEKALQCLQIFTIVYKTMVKMFFVSFQNIIPSLPPTHLGCQKDSFLISEIPCDLHFAAVRSVANLSGLSVKTSFYFA
jgi:hypothetical protein